MVQLYKTNRLAATRPMLSARWLDKANTKSDYSIVYVSTICHNSTDEFAYADMLGVRLVSD